MKMEGNMAKTYNLIDPNNPERKMTITLADDGNDLRP